MNVSNRIPNNLWKYCPLQEVDLSHRLPCLGCGLDLASHFQRMEYGMKKN